MGRLSGKIAFVTGGASGMGLATVKLFAAEGAQVVMADIRQAEGEAAAAAAAACGANICFVQLDVTSEADWTRAIAETQQRFGGLDVLVNNAGICTPATIATETKASFERTLAVNTVGPFLGMRAAIALMSARKKGSIINISSTEGLWGTGGMSAYVASKWAIRGLTKSAALELGAYGIRVNSVHPGLTNTPLANPTGKSMADFNQDPHFAARLLRQPIARASDPVEVAYVSLFLASDESSYVTGAEIAVDGGMTIGADTDMMHRGGGFETA